MHCQARPTKANFIIIVYRPLAYKFLVVIAAVLCSAAVHAQDEQTSFVMPESKIALPILSAPRQEIEALRAVEDVFGKEALYRGREYKRIDPTYYVGHMFEGMALYSTAADELGYQMAAQPLQKAMDLIEKDFNKYLRYRTNDVFTYLRVSKYQNEYDLIAGHLQECYQNSNQVSKAIQVIRRVQVRNLQQELYCDS
jgi:hypothetical protein